MTERLILAGLRRKLERQREAKDERIASNPVHRAAYLAEFERELREVNYWAAAVATIEARSAAAVQTTEAGERAA